MNEDPDSDSRRRKLIQYLLNEIPQEQKFEVEKLCNSELEWREEKKQIQQCLILLEEAGKDGFKLGEKFLEELSFSSEEKKDLRIAFEQGSMTAASGSKDENFKSNEKWVYRVPLFAGLVSLLIAYFGTLERKESQKLSLVESKQFEEFNSVSNDKIGPQVDANANIQEQIEKNGTKELPSNETLDGRGTLNSDPVKGSLQLARPSEKEDMKGLETKKDLPRSVRLGEFFKEDSPDENNNIIENPVKQVLDWNKMLSNSQEVFLHLQNGDAMGRIKILRSLNGNWLIQRADWPNRESSFALSQGKYQVRFVDELNEVYLLEGLIRKAKGSERTEEESKIPSYILKIEKAWILAEGEIRKEVDLPWE